MNYAQAEEKFRKLKTRFESGDLTEGEFKEQLLELMIEDEHGGWWMIGYETERWHHHDGTGWVPADPPGFASSLKGRSTVAHERKRKAGLEKLPIPVTLMAAAVAVLVLSLGGYYLFGGKGQEPGQTPIPQTGATEVDIAADPTTAATDPPASVETQTPEPTATTSSSDLSAFVSASRVTLYAGPDTKYGTVGSYPRDTRFTVLARNPSSLWLLCLAEDGKEGWLYYEWLAFDFDRMAIPTATYIPPLPSAPRKESDPKPTPCFGC